MDWSVILSDIESAVSALGSPLGGKLGGLLSAFVNAIPAIEQGITSAEPFIKAGISLIESGGQNITDEEWQAQLDALAGQTTTLDSEVAADNSQQ